MGIVQNVFSHQQEKEHCRSVKKLVESSTSTSTRSVVLADNGRFTIEIQGLKRQEMLIAIQCDLPYANVIRVSSGTSEGRE